MGSYLTHESWDDTVEARAFVAETLLSSAQSSKVLCVEFHKKCSLFFKNKKSYLTGEINQKKKPHSPAVFGTTSALN